MFWRRTRGTSLRLAVAVAALLALTPGTASAISLVPPKPSVFFGVSDRGTTAEFNEWAGLVGKHPALLQTFHPWGNGLNAAYERWRETGTRPILHISTAERPDPGGDDHAAADRAGRRRQLPAPAQRLLLPSAGCLPTSGRSASPTAASTPGRRSTATAARKAANTPPAGTRQAFRRIAAIVRGGQTLEELNATLAEIGLPPLNRTKGPNPAALPAAPLSIIWSPLPGGSPRVKGNFPGNYWPGSRWVDWASTDFYSQYPVWKDLNRFYHGKQWKGKPIGIAEWAVHGVDEPRFVKQLIAWVVKRPRVRMLVYYRGFGEAGNQYALGPYPRTTNTLRLKVRRPSFLSTAEYNAGTLPPLPPKVKTPPPTPTPPPEPAPTPPPEEVPPTTP